MQYFFKKRQKINTGRFSAVVLSLVIHAALFLLAGLLVIFSVINKPETTFKPPPAIERPKMKLKKPKVKVKKNSKPKQPKRIVAKVDKADMPDIQLPEMGGVGDGLIGGGLGSFETGPDLNTVSLMGSSLSIGNDFVGTFYDFKRDRTGRTIPYSSEAYRDIVRGFMKNGWKTSEIGRFYQSPKKLYATTFVVPPVLSEIAPAAFGEESTEGNYWMAFYQGQLVHNEGITFRFVGSGDDILAVRVAGEIVFASVWWSDEPQVTGDIWNSSSSDSKKYWLGNQTANMGDWITLEPGVPLNMEVIMTDNGGQACLMLGIQEKGVEYERTTMGGPIFPAFKTSILSHDMLDAIYKDLVPGELDLINGPVFCDFFTGGKVVEKKPAGTTAPEPAIAESHLRIWTGSGGNTIEAELVTVLGDQAVLKPIKGKQRKIPLDRLSDADRLFIELSDPPEFRISFARKSAPKFSIVEGGPSGNTVAYNFTYTVNVKQKSSGIYNHELVVEFFAIGEEIHGNNFVLLDRQKSRFTPSKENGRSHSFTGKTVELPNFTLEEIHRGLKDSGYLITMTDSRGKIIAYDSSSNWLFKNMEKLKNLPVGSYMDKTCTRVYATGPKRTRY